MFETKKYEDILKNMETGDLVLFSGRYSISKMVEELEHCPWSHVGMVVKFANVDKPLFWESTVLVNLPDQIYNDNKTGPKLVDLYSRLKTYGQDVTPYEPPVYSFRKLNVERTPDMLEKLENLFTTLHGIPNPDKTKMIWEVFEGKIFNIPSKKDNYTCGELIAESYENMGIIDTKKVVNAYSPKDFSSYGKLPMLKGFFDKEVIIDLK